VAHHADADDSSGIRAGVMTKDEEALVKSLRAKHHPQWAQLDDILRKKLPHFDEFELAGAVCSLLEVVQAEDEMVLRDANPGLERVQ
jgi:hypothetical protein